MKAGDLVLVDYEALHGLPCLLYSKHKGACKVYDPARGHLRAVVADRVFIINKAT